MASNTSKKGELHRQRDEKRPHASVKHIRISPRKARLIIDQVRGKDLDDKKANAAKAAAEESLKNAKSEIDMARAQSELVVLAAQLSALRRFRQKK